MAQQKVQFIVEAVDKASQTLKNVEQSVSKTAKNWVDKNESLVGASNAFALGLAGAATAGGFFVKSMVDEAAAAEQTKVAFTTMTGSAANADKLIRDMVGFAAKTPFELKGLENETKKLLAYGFSQDEVLGELKKMGDIAAGVGMDKLPQLTLAYGQVRAAGKLTGAELRQFTEAGVPMLEELAKVTGISMKDMGDAISDGAIGFDEVQKALGNLSGEGGRFFNLMEKQSATFSGMMSNLSDAWTQFLRTSGAPVMEMLKGVLKVLLEFVNVGLPAIIQKMQEWATYLKENPALIYGIAAAITAMLVPSLIAASVAAAPMLLAFGQLILIAAAVGAAVYALKTAWDTNFLGMRDGILAFIEFVKQLPAAWNTAVEEVKVFLENIKQATKDAFDAMMQNIKEFWDKFGTAIEVVVGAITGLYLPTLIQMAATTAIQMAKVVASWVLMGAQALANSIIVTVQAIPAMLSSLIGFAVSSAVNAAKVVASWVLMGAQALLQGARMAAAWVLAMGPVGWVTAAVIALGILIYKNWDEIVAFTKDLWGKILVFFQNVWTAIKTAVSDAINLVKSIIQGGLSATQGIVSGLLGGIQNSFSSAFNAAKNIVSGIMDGMKNIVQSAVNSILSIINGLKDAINGAVSWVNGKVQGIQNSVSNAYSTAKNGLSSAANYISAPFRALGGPVQAGQPYRVGEKGVELFVPNTAGRIVSNSDLAKSGGGASVTVSFGNVTISNGLDWGSFQSQVQKIVYDETRKANLGLGF